MELHVHVSFGPPVMGGPGLGLLALLRLARKYAPLILDLIEKLREDVASTPPGDAPAA